jgi:phosphate transport system protein
MAVRMHYEERMNELERTVVKMGSVVVSKLERSMEALINQDAELANNIIKSDQEIDDLEIDINDQCITLIAEEQPVAKDLRIILSSLKISHSLERIGDNAVHIAKSTIKLSKEPYMKPLIDIPKMAGIAIQMLKDSLDAYVKLDCDCAVEISKRDIKVDDLYSHIFRDLVTHMHDDPAKISQAMLLLFICRRLERVADQSTHICEGIFFVACGKHVELNQ